MLHLGNVTFCEPPGQHDASTVSPGPASAALDAVAQLIGAPREQLLAALTTRTRQTPDGAHAGAAAKAALRSRAHSLRWGYRGPW